jgi:hypothetical protein
MQKNPLNRRVSPTSAGLVVLIWACQGLNWPDDSDFGPLELSVARRLATPLGNRLLMPPPLPAGAVFWATCGATPIHLRSATIPLVS